LAEHDLSPLDSAPFNLPGAEEGTVIKGITTPLAIEHIMLRLRIKMSVLVVYRYNVVYDIFVEGIDSCCWRIRLSWSDM
jgi:hypothetical protein